MSFLNKLLTGDISLLHENGIEGSEVRKIAKFTSKVYNEPNKTKITQEMIDEYKNYKEKLEKNDIKYGFDLIDYMIKREIPFSTNNITQELIDEYNIYLENLKTLVKYGLTERSAVNNDINIHKEKISNELLIKMLEQKIEGLYSKINSYSDTVMVNKDYLEKKKIWIMRTENEIRQLERYIDKLSADLNTNMDTMYCRFCGTKIPTDSKFCKECGEKL